jgi:fatty acid desaturase
VDTTLASRPQAKLDRLSREDLAPLSQLSPSRFCLALAFDLAVIAFAVVLSERVFFNPAVYLVSVVLIGSRLHALGVLMHECVHYRAFKSHKLNMFVGELLGLTVLTSAEGYRNNHLRHHTHLNTDQDPDWVRKVPQKVFHFPKTRVGVLRAFLLQLSGVGIVRLFISLRKSPDLNRVSRSTRLMRLGLYVAVLVGAIATGGLGKLALYWLVPMLTTFPFLFYIRSVAEHHGNLPYDHTYTNSRTTVAQVWEGFLFMPHNVGYHIEHHLYPQVPFYRLPKLHALLMQRAQYAEKANVTRGVCTGLLREWLAPARGPRVA